MVEPENARVIQISDTLHLTRLRVSEAYFDEVRKCSNLTLVGDPFEFPVDSDGWMRDVDIDASP
jgi:hypothetical protein